MNKLNKKHILLGGFIIFIQVHATSQSSLSKDPRFNPANNNVTATIKNMVSGDVTETKDKLIISGATFINKPGSSDSNIVIPQGYKKEVFIVNSQIISDGFSQKNREDMASLVKINNSKGDGKIVVRDLKVTSHDTSTFSSSKSSSACAAVICAKLAAKDQYFSVVELLGENNFKSQSQ